jgi:1-acyl-sn-glycerol-3-phosphate acyltransferase
MRHAGRKPVDIAYGIASSVLFALVAPIGYVAIVCAPRRSRLALLRRIGIVVSRVLAIEVALEGTLPEPPAVLVANHASYLDAFVMMIALDQPVVFAAGSVLREQLVAGSFLRAIGMAFVGGSDERGLASLEPLRAVLRKRGSVAFFPEGSLASTREVRRFRLGAFVLAIDEGVPVVPIAIIGTRALLPPGARLIRRARVKVRVGPLLDPHGPARALAGRAQSAIRSMLVLGEESPEELADVPASHDAARDVLS